MEECGVRVLGALTAQILLLARPREITPAVERRVLHVIVCRLRRVGSVQTFGIICENGNLRFAAFVTVL
jgi:hypothetical protein